ncbi:MAG: energy transducer TonB [Candidatus Acidiferrales bacterium]
MSDLGSLSHCLVDSDTEAFSRARRLRRKALVISLIFEAGLVAAMLLWPLITPGVLPRQYNVTPAPPFHGGGAGPSHPHEPFRRHPPNWHPPIFCTMCAPPVIPTHPSIDGPEPPNIDNGPGGRGTGDPNLPGTGPEFPGGFDFGSRQPVIRPPEPPEARGPVRKPAEVMQAMLVHQVQPEYPKVALAAHISGTVELRAIIGKDGVVRELQVLSGNPLLVQSARVAVSAWRYKPTLLNGQPVEVETYVTVKFVLD